MTTGNREDYLINILRLTEKRSVAKTTELASMMDVSAASVSEMLKTLSNEGMVNYQKYKGVSLTQEGFEYATQLRRKHHIMERFLINVLESDMDTAHEEAHKMEHVISDESADKMCRILGPTDECDDCKESCGIKGSRSTTTVSMMPSQSSGKVSHVKCGNPEHLRKLMSMGFVPGRPVKIDSVSKSGPVIVHIGDCSVAMDRVLTDMVYVDMN